MPGEWRVIYDDAYNFEYRSNVNDAPRAARVGEFNRKIENFCRQHGFNREEIVANIESNRIVAAFFAKNPNKQNFYEKTAERFIRSLKGVSGFKGSRDQNKDLINGAVINKSTIQKSGGVSDAKTIDFEWNYSACKFYAYHKYTKEGGGSQDNQYKDLQVFIKHANMSTATHTYFIAIADGAYYESQVSEQTAHVPLERIIK